NWTTLYTTTNPHPTPLPTYPFQHHHYWLTRNTSTGDIASAGLHDPAHPLLTAAVHLPDTGGTVLTGRLSLTTHPWLADHTVSGAVLLPGAAMAELAIRAGDETDTPTLEELVIEQPLALPDSGSLDLRVVVGGPDESERRDVRVYSRVEESAQWTEHATGTLAQDTTAPPPPAVAEWPPVGAEPVAVEGLYVQMAEGGYDYGPTFQGLRAVWTRDGEVFAEAALPEEQSEAAGRFGIHPALLDAALHASNYCLPGEPGSRMLLPFAWNDIRLQATGATSVRVHARYTEDTGLSVALVDAAGGLVASIGSLILREVDAEQLEGLTSTSLNDALWTVTWTEHSAITATDEVPWGTVGDISPALATAEAPAFADVTEVAEAEDRPTLIVADTTAWESRDTEPTGRARGLATRALDLLQQWVTLPELSDTRLVILTHGALAVHDSAEVTDPAAAAIWGLVRSAQSEHPGRVHLIDTDGHSNDALTTAFTTALTTDQPQLALRDNTLRAPQLTAAPTNAPAQPLPLDPEGTVLITGGTGTLGALTARHLITHHGARHLVLTSRQGPDAPGATELATELTQLGAHIHITACDTADRDQLTTTLADIDADHPLTAVIHTAGTLDDALLTDLTPQRLDTVFRPKVDALTHLHDLTHDNHDLAAFVV
ncbi:type I polyketide synthase, partial [Streptomyces sp. NPDC003442]